MRCSIDKTCCCIVAADKDMKNRYDYSEIDFMDVVVKA
jgi:hypothetical protein